MKKDKTTLILPSGAQSHPVSNDDLLREDHFYRDQEGMLRPSSTWLYASRALFDKAFVSRLKRTSSPAHDIRRTLKGIELPKITDFGQMTDTVLTVRDIETPVELDVSEETRLLDSAWNDHELHGYHFWGMPTRVVGPDGVTESDLANNYVHHVRELIASKRFLSRYQARKAESLSRAATIKRDIERVATVYSGLYVHRLDLDCGIGNEAGQDAATMIKHVNNFLTELEANESLASLGYIWCREFLEEVGYRFHITLFYNHQLTPCNETTVKTIGELWSKITDAKGRCFDAALLPSSHRAHGTYRVGDSYAITALIESWRWLCMRNLLIRLKPHKRMSDFGIKMPSIAETMMEEFHASWRECHAFNSSRQAMSAI